MVIQETYNVFSPTANTCMMQALHQNEQNSIQTQQYHKNFIEPEKFFQDNNNNNNIQALSH